MLKFVILIACVALARCGEGYGQETSAPTVAPATTAPPSWGQTTAQPTQGYGQTAQPTQGYGQTGQPTQGYGQTGQTSAPGSGGQGSSGPCRLPNGQIVQSSSYAAPSNGAVQKTSGQNGLLSGNQADVLPIGVNDNNILPILNANQIAIPICATNILNGDSILNPDIGSIGVLAPVAAAGNSILSNLLRRRRDAVQATNGQSGTASGNQVDVLPVGVNGNNVLPVANGNQIAVPVDLSNIANGDSILNPNIGSIGVAVPVLAAGNEIASNLLGGSGLPNLPLVGGGLPNLPLKK